MRTCDGNENCKKKATTTTIGLLSKLSFLPYRRGWGIQQSVTPGDSALTVQPLAWLGTILLSAFRTEQQIS